MSALAEDPGAGTVAFVEAPTEERNPRTLELDRLDTEALLLLINDEDATVAAAVRAAVPQLAALVDLAVDALGTGRRVHYFGAGTSGRVAAMDAAELIPTYGLEPGRVVAHHAGGTDAMVRPVENVEDDEAAGAAAAAELVAGDLAIGLTASGRTPFVAGALQESRGRGAATGLLSANPRAALAPLADVHVALATGAEVVAGSTRMKAGTAQKLALNAFSTATMVRLGFVYSNLMVAVQATNAKLRGRVVRVLVEATGLDAHTCSQALRDAGGDCRTALVALLAACDTDTAASALAADGGNVRAALTRLAPRTA